MSPSITNCFPEFDQLYPIATCALVGLRVLTLERNRIVFAAAFGLVFGVATLFSYNLLVLGVLFAGLTIYSQLRVPRMAVGDALAHAGAALGAFVTWYLVIWLVSGFDPLESFRSALNVQEHLLTLIARPYPATVLFDLTDIAMGLAWIPLLWIVFDLVESMRSGESRALVFSALSAVQLLAIALSGLLPGETFRVWAFTLPLLALPAGRELARWPFGPRMAALGCLWLLTTVIAQNMVFIAP